MDYNYCMAIIIMCLVAMGCLCCLWIACCAIALRETKFASPINDLSYDVAPESNTGVLFKEDS